MSSNRSFKISSRLIASAGREGIVITSEHGLGRAVIRWPDVRTLASDSGAMIVPTNLLTLEQCAALVGLNLSTLYQYHHTGQREFPAPVHRLGVVKFWSRDSITAWNARRLESPLAKR
jgi:predicted DNA-binding transcriptional regulator AlpA